MRFVVDAMLTQRTFPQKEYRTFSQNKQISRMKPTI